MFLSLITLAVALSLSVIAAYYSIAGLAAIFAAAVIPIMIMGSILELAKVVVTLWLHEYWSRCRWLMKLYLVPAVMMLMLITSMGIFGFLSKAHSDQSLVSGDVIAKIAVYDEKIKTEKENIDVSRKSLKQMDEAVDQVMGRSSDEKGADKAVAVRRGQQKERQRLLAEISESQTRISALNEQRAPIAAEVRKVEAEVGPIKYIAALIYGDNTDTNVLERAVRWVIILLVCVFDPLAIMMLLAATESLKWARKPLAKDISEDGGKTSWPTRPHIPGYDDQYVKWPGGVGPTETTAEKEFDINDHPYLFTPQGSSTPPGIEPVPIQVYRPSDPELDPCYKCGTPLMNAPGIGPFCPNRDCDVSDGPFSDDQEPIKFKFVSPTAHLDDDHYDTDSAEIKHAKEQWKADNPGDTLKRHRRLLEVGVIDQLPWTQYLDKAPESGFGNVLPEHGNKGDTFVSTIGIPHRLYKHNGSEWLRIDNTQQDNYTYDIAYVDHLISQIEKGLYDPDQLNDSERDQIEQRITQNK
jgi:hypothetical protein